MIGLALIGGCDLAWQQEAAPEQSTSTSGSPAALTREELSERFGGADVLAIVSRPAAVEMLYVMDPERPTLQRHYIAPHQRDALAELLTRPSSYREAPPAAPEPFPHVQLRFVERTGAPQEKAVDLFYSLDHHALLVVRDRRLIGELDMTPGHAAFNRILDGIVGETPVAVRER